MIEPGFELWCEVVAADEPETVDDLGQSKCVVLRGHIRTVRPDKGDGFRRVAHVVARHSKEFGIQMLLDQFQKRATNGKAEWQGVRQCRQSPTAIGIRRGAEVGFQ